MGEKWNENLKIKERRLLHFYRSGKINIPGEKVLWKQQDPGICQALVSWPTMDSWSHGYEGTLHAIYSTRGLDKVHKGVPLYVEYRAVANCGCETADTYPSYTRALQYCFFSLFDSPVSTPHPSYLTAIAPCLGQHTEMLWGSFLSCTLFTQDDILNADNPEAAHLHDWEAVEQNIRKENGKPPLHLFGGETVILFSNTDGCISQ